MRFLKQTILIIEDDIQINNMLHLLLQENGYNTVCSFSGTEALLVPDSVDLILLDLMLPGRSGEDIIRELKEKHNAPVIVISAISDVDKKVSLFSLGADDYITKPFDTKELLARIEVQLRKNKDTSAFRAGEITLFPDLLAANINGNEVRLTRTECAILKLLMQCPYSPVGKLTILEKISTDTPDCTERSLKQHISNIRHKLQKVSGKDYIEAVYGIGFMLKS